MKIGFTGTREGMTRLQIKLLVEYLVAHNITEGHSGDCLGADEEFHIIVQTLLGATSVGHPPIDPKYRAFCAFDVTHQPTDYLVRNANIVGSCELLIGAPKETYEVTRGSGTWHCIRYAANHGREHRIIYPDGAIGTYSERKHGN